MRPPVLGQHQSRACLCLKGLSQNSSLALSRFLGHPVRGLERHTCDFNGLYFVAPRVLHFGLAATPQSQRSHPEH